MTKAEMNNEALLRATTGNSQSNYRAIVKGFLAMGIDEKEILPRENCFTFRAWLALGRVVRRGEHGVKISTFISFDEKKQTEQGDVIKVKSSAKPCRTTVFHISQTELIDKTQEVKTESFEDCVKAEVEKELVTSSSNGGLLF